MKNISYRFILKPATSDDGSYHSWRLPTKDIIAPAQNTPSAPTSSFSAFTERSRFALFIRQTELLSVFDFVRVDNKPVLLDIDDLLSHFILMNHYLCDSLHPCRHIALGINKDFHELVAGRELTALNMLVTPCPVWLDDFSRGRTSSPLLERFRFDYVKVDKDYFWDKENDLAFSGLPWSIHTLTNHVTIEGIETEKQKQLISAVGDIIGQSRY